MLWRDTLTDPHWLCPKCGGVFISESDMEPVKTLSRLQGIVPKVQLKSYFRSKQLLSCPKCLKTMKRLITESSKIELDRCSDCAGYWLDLGEFEASRKEQLAKDNANGSTPSDTFLKLYFDHRDSTERNAVKLFRWFCLLIILVDIFVYYKSTQYGSKYLGVARTARGAIPPHVASLVSLVFASISAMFPSLWGLILIALYYTFVGFMTWLALSTFNG